MVPSDPNLPRAAERTLRFLDEVDMHRLTVTSAPLSNVGQSASEFAARFAAPERERPMLKFLDPDDVRQTMSYFARTRVHTEIVERIVEVPVETRVYVPMRTFGPREPARAGGPPAGNAPAPNAAPASERSERRDMPPARPGAARGPAETPYAGMDQAVQSTLRRTMVANVGAGSYLAGLFAASPASSPGLLASFGRLAQTVAPSGVPGHAFAPGSPFLGVPGLGAPGIGVPGMGGAPGASNFPGLAAMLGGSGVPGPLATMPRLLLDLPMVAAAISQNGGPASGSLFGDGPVARLAPIVEEAVRRANGGPALLFRLPGAASQVAAERGVGGGDLDTLDRAIQIGAARVSGPQAASLGQVTLVAPDLRLASKDAAAAGTAVALPWQALAAGAGPLDESGLAGLRPLLPAGAHLIYPALPVGTPGATNLPLAQGLVARIMGAYGPTGAAAAQAIAAQAAQAGGAARGAPTGPGRVSASIVPTGRPSAVGPGGLFGGKGDPLAEAGAGQAKRGGALDFLGVPVQLAPSLATDPGLRRERSLAKAVAGASGGPPASPESFGLLRQRLFPKVGSIVAEPDMPAWRRRAQESGLRDANPAALLAPDARAPRPDAAAKPQLESGPLAQAARPFAPALALAEQVAGRGGAGAALSARPPAFASPGPALPGHVAGPASRPAFPGHLRGAASAVPGATATGPLAAMPAHNRPLGVHSPFLSTPGGPATHEGALPGRPTLGAAPGAFAGDGSVHPTYAAPFVPGRPGTVGRPETAGTAGSHRSSPMGFGLSGMPLPPGARPAFSGLGSGSPAGAPFGPHVGHLPDQPALAGDGSVRGVPGRPLGFAHPGSPFGAHPGGHPGDGPARHAHRSPFGTLLPLLGGGPEAPALGAAASGFSGPGALPFLGGGRPGSPSFAPSGPSPDGSPLGSFPAFGSRIGGAPAFLPPLGAPSFPSAGPLGLPHLAFSGVPSLGASIAGPAFPSIPEAPSRVPALPRFASAPGASLGFFGGRPALAPFLPRFVSAKAPQGGRSPHVPFAPFLPRFAAAPGSSGTSGMAPNPGGFPFAPIPGRRLPPAEGAFEGRFAGAPSALFPRRGGRATGPAFRPTAPRIGLPFTGGRPSFADAGLPGRPYLGIAPRPPQTLGFGRPGAPGASPDRPFGIALPRSQTTFPGLGSRPLGFVAPSLAAGPRRIAGTAAPRPGMAGRPGLSRGPWIGPRVPDLSLDVPGASPSIELPAVPRPSLPRPSAGPLRPSASEPPAVTVSMLPADPGASLAMPVLKRPTPIPAKPAASTAVGPIHVQRALAGSSASSSSPSSGGGSSESNDGGRPDGERVQVIAREVYGILRRRLRDELERAKPYDRF